MLPDVIRNVLGKNITACQPVHGGDINHACRLTTGSGLFFLKYNNARQYPGMLQQEAAALQLLQQTQTVRVPAVVQTGIAGPYQFLMLEWLQPAAPTPLFWERLGQCLAALHRCTAPVFGNREPNYIGSLPQNNTSCTSWEDFYTHYRILPLVRQLADDGVLEKKYITVAENCCNRLQHAFPPEPPALLHGDLWSGNILCTNNSQPVLIDPAVYYGHREMDLGMTLLFGGFDARFYAAYTEAYPLAPDWKERVWLTQLYPLLVHAVLFGGHYLSRIRALLQSIS